MKDLLDKMKKLNENKNGKVITFDFDNTIVKSYEDGNDGFQIQYKYGGVNPEIIKRVKKFKKDGYTVLIVTSRNVSKEVPETSVSSMLRWLELEVDGIFYTNDQRKAQKLYELGSSLHYDDDPREHEAIKAFTNLHQDFNISVKYPDQLLSDIDEIAKGILMTSDNRFIIAQRSDSLEWDAVGGHLMQGEEPDFAFWRETKEELSILPKNLTYIDSLETTWKKKKKIVHYFLGHVDESSEELKGAINLQWELADYFCGTLEEIDKEMNSSHGSTQNLRNTMSLLLHQGDLLLEMETYQKKMYKNHSQMKKKIIGFEKGTNKSTGAKGLKKIKTFKRSKSAPPGFGAIGEEKDSKKQKKIKISIVNELDERKKRKKRKKRRKKRKKGMGSWSTWPYGAGGSVGSVSDSDGGGDGGGGE
jgi:ADP-ribose pyrophosphatase YjhB (NUDIX family)